MLNLKEDISAKDVVDAIIKTRVKTLRSSTGCYDMKKQFAHNPFVFYRFPSMRKIPFKIEKHPYISLNRCYGIGFLHVREDHCSTIYAVFLLEVEDAPFVKVRQVITYGAFAYINRIIFDYEGLKKEKKDIPPIEETEFCFGAKVNRENLLKD